MATGVLGLFQHVDRILEAAGKLKGSGFEQITLMSPIPLEGVEEVLGKKKSVIKRFALFGAIIGGLSGFLLAAGTAVLYVLPTGGRPIITVPPYLIITYEMTILFGVLATLIGFFISARLPAWKDRTYTHEISVDRFGVLVACGPQEDAGLADKIMLEEGAEEVRKVEQVQ